MLAKPNQKIKDLVAMVDDKYREAKQERISRLDPAWGKWSRQFNLDIKPKMADEEYGPYYKFLFNYWILKSQLLELHHKHRLGRQRQKKKLAREASDIKKTLLTGLSIGEEVKAPSLKELASQILGG